MTEHQQYPVGFISGDFMWTGSQWIPTPSPSQATAYFVRTIALLMFGNIFATAGGFSVLATGGDDISLFVVGGIIALVFLVLAIITYTRGTSAQMRWDRVSRPPSIPPPVAQP